MRNASSMPAFHCLVLYTKSANAEVLGQQAVDCDHHTRTSSCGEWHNSFLTRAKRAMANDCSAATVPF